ncbi:FliH/SctL family protein [Arthrobacter sp. RIT-PI-e]|uniref:FliH/SctL family protein n=1 Tax=Arthrobacter sp. RIT-PI-e TaxID=1681197 RepID=UPI0009E5C684|nr:FliH/SctL family protein [Arthrobacter sp. RIT-PI-e]
MSTDGLVPITFPRLGSASGQAADDIAFARGHAAGYASGLALAHAELDERRAHAEAESAAARARAEAAVQQRLRVLDSAVRALEARTAPVLAEARERILDTSFHVAELIVGHALEDEAASARAAVARALQGTGEDEVRAVHLHPADLALLTRDERIRPEVVLVADASLGRGDAVTQLTDGTIDARLGAALDRVRAVFGAGSGAP